jgi:ribosome recycling factor
MHKDGLPEDEMKKGEIDIQKLTDDHSAKIEKVIEGKEKEILTV